MIVADNISIEREHRAVLAGVSLSVAECELLSIVGPSGCGKSTLLDGLSGASGLKVTQGAIRNTSKAIGYSLQDPVLLPWRTAIENAELAVEVSQLDSCETALWFRRCGLENDGAKLANQLSGGMQQRVALIRTLLPTPNALLLDEPFTGLDFDTKLEIQRHILDFQTETRCAILMVTHDIEDAIALSDRVLVLGGKPATVMKEIPIELGLSRKDPVEARKSPKFTEYFSLLWESLQAARA